MIVTIAERLVLLGILPREGDVLTIKVIRDLKDEIAFSDQELVDLKLEQVDEGRRTVWDAEAAEKHKKDIDFGTKGVEIIKETLQNLDAKKILSIEALPLWEKFVETPLKVVEAKEPKVKSQTRAVKRRQSAKKPKK